MDGQDVNIPRGRHLIAGEWVAGEGTFRSSPWTGEGRDFAVGSPTLVDRACKAAEAASPAYSALTRERRAVFLERVAEEIEARGPAITEVGHLETGLPKARLEGNRHWARLAAYRCGLLIYQWSSQKRFHRPCPWSVRGLFC